MRKVILNMVADEKRGAVLDNNEIVEWLFEQEDDRTRIGNIFLGKVMDIVPGMEAAFVDIGVGKNGFLFRNDLLAFQPYKEKKLESPPSIRKLITKGQSIIVQITKEAVGTKGVRLTEVCSLPGKYLVYLPFGSYVAVSKKMSSEEVREEWRRRSGDWLSEKEGIIIRTIGEQQNETEVYGELERLREEYNKISEDAKMIQPPKLLYNQSSLVHRVVRDYVTSGHTEVYVDERESYRQLIKWVEDDSKKNVKLYQEKEDIFHAFDLEKNLEKTLRRHVWLKNGGFLVIERTEALTVIDVNTGKFVGKTNLRETVLKTNIEAAHIVAEQLRLRDIGGIILIDFIDMKVEEDREQVLTTLKKSFKKDRSLTNIAGFTQFGLVEMTRKKARSSIDSILLDDCPNCLGTGKIQSVSSSISSISRDLYTLRHSECEAILLDVEESILDELLLNNKEKIRSMEDSINKKLFLLPLTMEDAKSTSSKHVIRLMGGKLEIKEIWKSRYNNK
ncbi:Rne/Rng family ribonuclease [Evansella sp. AB-P1]|uniref:Rne/Rng family ribonuclease n=1 Tax=Evansella sp. AB-P1 TaxID=3037653 RepID=UPI00241F4460|nr:Rne/Rng family ribonuclease [Evansella sp. AB-P1]MDG5786843.1 Rne/Rng family ribonuclease [Evansella sp. AB-P1]